MKKPKSTRLWSKS